VKKLITIFSFLLIGISTQAQDFVFSQFQLSPLNLNPALTGTNSGDQVIVNYRGQWQSILEENAFKTLSISYDRPITLASGDVIGVGAKITNDVAGRSDFTIRNASLLFSYQKKLFKNKKAEHFIIGGLESGLSQQSADFDDLRWGTQHDGNGGFDSTLVSGGDFDNNVFFADFATGITYQIRFGNQRLFSIGGSINHLFRPNASFSETGESNLYRRYAFHGSYDLKLFKNFLLTSRAVYFNQGSSELWIGSLGAKYFMKEHTVEFNFGQRFVPLGLQSFFVSPVFFVNNKIGISATFEFNTNELNGSGIDSYGGSVIYRFGKNKSTEITE